MILGIGTDITSIPRIAAVLEEQGDRFVSRCFAPGEIAHVEKTPARRAAGYAKRWAAKEAAAKALGRGIRGGIYLKDIIVTNDAEGRPSLTFRGGAKDRLTEITPGSMTAEVHVSLSDEETAALAFVVISAAARK